MKMVHAELLDTEGIFFFLILLQHSPAAMAAPS